MSSLAIFCLPKRTGLETNSTVECYIRYRKDGNLDIP